MQIEIFGTWGYKDGEKQPTMNARIDGEFLQLTGTCAWGSGGKP
jgi:hypothetical protein